MENPAILDLDYPTFAKIRTILEDPNTMKSFLEVLPPDCSCDDVLIAMDIESRQYNMTRAKYLLTFLGSKGFRVSDLIEWFQAINLEKALIHLKKDEPLRIIDHPSEVIRINEGEELILTCTALSYPPPDYSWYKNDEALLLQVEPVLSIKSARLEDSGTYTCLVTKWCSQTNQCEWIYSNFSNVKIIPKNLHPSPTFCEKTLLPLSSSVLPEKCASSSKTAREELPSVKENSRLEKFNNANGQIFDTPNTEIITVTRHPFVDGKISQGMSICLNCEAVSSSAISYLWYKNGRPLYDEKSSQLILKYLFPDPDTGESKWEYKCKVYNEYDHVFCNTVVVELDEIKDTTPCIAQKKVAFMVANDIYDHLENLKKPVADVCDVANLLSSMDFKTFAFRNLTLTEMRNAIAWFCKILKPGSYALFYFAGHGFELYGQTYLQPVDSSDRHYVQESICSEYILQCMQETKPAVNILLIDSCRKLPPNLSGSGKSKNDILPGRIFQARMKNNTIYGYSTSFLYASHESDAEVNSIFVKHLKKYITYKRNIPEMLLLVQRDFAKDPLTKNLQHPVIESTLSDPRKLCDPLAQSAESLTSATGFCVLDWCDIKRSIINRTINLLNLKVAFVIEFHHHMEVFCNGIDVFVYLHVEQNADFFILHDMDVNIIFNSNILRVLPMHGISLKSANLQKGKQNLLFKKQLYNVHKMPGQCLNGDISLKFFSKNAVKNISFSIDIAKIAELQLSVNHLQSSNVEEHKDYSLVENCVA